MSKKEKEFTPINKHKRKGKILERIPSEMNIKELNWERDLMPEFIWLDLLTEEYGELNCIKLYIEFTKRIDKCLEKQPK